jgi:6-pyruvoyltetrahydropterin/6-carboxytetrahydropterin synthase
MSYVARITRRLTLDAGHRVPGHQGKCRNLHGHTYTVEVTAEGEVPEDGMVLDFGVVKEVMVEHVGRWDHAFLVWEGDAEVLKALDVDPSWQRIITPWPPTAENLARLAAILLYPDLASHGIALVEVRVWETPNCFATWTMP